MPIQDSSAFRELISRLLPGLNIHEVAQPSGQRVVYFGRFDSISRHARDYWGNADVCRWGDIVVKASGGISPESITYLQREIATLNELDSIYYPTLHYYEVFSSDPVTDEPLDERLFVTVEEFIPSTPLSRCHESFSTQAGVVDLLVQLVQALRLLWDRKPSLVHRDIKPENILIKPNGSPAIIDLGIVRVEGTQGVTKTGAIFGPCTPHYSSPEQARNDKANISFKSDVFALGTLAYALLSGANPFLRSANTPIFEVLNDVCTLEPPRLIEFAPVSRPLSDLIAQMMQKEPYRRPRTPGALANSLNELARSKNES